MIYLRNMNGIEDEIDTKQVIKIAVFIKEVLDYDLFEKYEWC